MFGHDDDNDDENDSDDEFKDKETKVKGCNRKNSEDISKCAEIKTPFKRRKRDTQSSQMKSGIEYGYGSDSNTDIKNSKDDNKITTFTKKNSINYFFIQLINRRIVILFNFIKTLFVLSAQISVARGLHEGARFNLFLKSISA